MAHPITRASQFNYETLNKELEFTGPEKDLYEAYLAALNDDFWQKGRGSLLPEASGPTSSVIDRMLERRFVFRNVIKECVSRVSGAFFGKAPNWRIESSEGEVSDDVREAIEKALGEFWEREKVADVLAQAFETRLAFGRGGIRIYVPRRYKARAEAPEEEGAEGGSASENTLDQATAPDYLLFSSFEEAMGAIRIEYVPPGQSRLLDDDGELFSIVRYGVRVNWSTKETHSLVEFSFVDDTDATFVGTVAEKGQGVDLASADLSSPLELGGRTTFREMTGIPYVTKALFKNNQLVNLALTCSGFSMVDNGFGEMILTNVELDEEVVMSEDGSSIRVPKRIRRGGGVVQNFVGIENVDESTGATSRSTPGVTFRDPTPMNSFSDGYNLGYEACLQEAGQLYALISGDATPSGESRIQALADFLLKIRPYKAELDEQGSWLLTTAMLLAGQLADIPLPYLRVIYDSRVHISDMSASDKTAVMSMREKGVISRETERVLLGLDDPALESEQVIREQQTSIVEIPIQDLNAKLDVALKLQSVGVDNYTIQGFLGFSPEEIQIMDNTRRRLEAEILAQIEAENSGTSPEENPAEGMDEVMDETAEE